MYHCSFYSDVILETFLTFCSYSTDELTPTSLAPTPHLPNECPYASTAILTLEAYNWGLEAPIWTCRGSFRFLKFSAFI